MRNGYNLCNKFIATIAYFTLDESAHPIHHNMWFSEQRKVDPDSLRLTLSHTRLNMARETDAAS